MTEQEIRDAVARFPVWHYELDLDGVRTPGRAGRTARHPWRKRYFFDPLVRLLGGTLQGRRVLDLGCNAGFWSLAALESGADFVLGIDARRMHIEQSELVFQVKHCDARRYRFLQGDVFDDSWARFGPFDVVLCLGLLYHVNRPMVLLDAIARHNSDLLVVDTSLSTLAGSVLELRRESTDDPRHAATSELVMVPTAGAVRDMARSAGYDVATLAPPAADVEGVGDFETGRRRAFICAKRTDLRALDVATER